MDELEIYNKMREIVDAPNSPPSLDEDNDRARMIAEHRTWLRSIRHERPSTSTRFRIGVYIRYFNQTKYNDYLSFHKKQFADTIALCPKWTLIDFYVDEGSNTPNMESSPEWCRLIQDCFEGTIDLIITQKVSSVSRKPREIALLSRLLAAQNHPIGIYFISEDIFTLASYYQEDLRDVEFLPSTDSCSRFESSIEERMLPDD